MKKLFTLLAFVALCVTASAQSENGDGPLKVLQSSLSGDADGDGIITFLDYTVTRDYILGNPPETFFFENADMNNDEEITVTDVQKIVGCFNPYYSLLSNNSNVDDSKRIKTRPAANAYFTVDEVDVMQGKKSKVSVCYDCDVDFYGFQVELLLPMGFHVVSAQLGAEVSANNPNMELQYSCRESDQANVFLGTQPDNNTMPFGEGIELFSFYVEADEDIEIGEYPFGTTRIEFASDDKILGRSQTLVLNVVPYAARVLLDTDTYLPIESEFPEDVIVKRHVSAGVWSTLCLPFELSYDQLMEIFGEGMQLAEFDGTEISSENENVLIVLFETIEDGLEANHPYLIKSENELEEFTVKDVVVWPDEYDIHYQVSNDFFHGTLMYDDYYAENGHPLVYIKNNKFYYNEVSILMKAFRGYFEFEDFEPAQQANTLFVVDGEPTTIEGLSVDGREMTSGDVYSVSGMYMGRAEKVMNSLPHGVYVINNKKVVVR